MRKRKNYIDENFLNFNSHSVIKMNATKTS